MENIACFLLVCKRITESRTKVTFVTYTCIFQKDERHDGREETIESTKDDDYGARRTKLAHNRNEWRRNVKADMA